jgi:hypothetical protein
MADTVIEAGRHAQKVGDDLALWVAHLDAAHDIETTRLSCSEERRVFRDRHHVRHQRRPRHPCDIDGKGPLPVDMPQRCCIDNDIEAGGIASGWGRDDTSGGGMPDLLGEVVGLGVGPIGDGQCADPGEAERNANRLPHAPSANQQHPCGDIDGPMRCNGVDHRDPVKGFADQAAIGIDADRVDDPAGPGIGEQRITQAGRGDLVGHGYGKPGEIAQVPQAR